MRKRFFSAIVFLPILLGVALPCAFAQQARSQQSAQQLFPWTKIDESRVREIGIRKLEGRRLVLYTDLTPAPEVDELPALFDAALELWCKYFKLDAKNLPDWRMRASLIDNRERFVASGLLPADLPKFYNGYTKNLECWLNNQTSPYYRRHLLLHEGVHGFMFTLLGNHAPPWYVEGMAEFLGTHRWKNGKLELPYFPLDPQEVPKLGRIEIVQADFAHACARRFGDVMAYDSKAYLVNEPYAWSWAAVAFLDGHPNYRDRFRRLVKLLPGDRDFNEELKRIFGRDFDRICEEWQIFVADIDHGYDFSRSFLDWKPGKPMPDDAGKATVEADRGWQNSGLRLEAGKKYTLTAAGQYQVANEAPPWISEPPGVSIRYVRGRPLGQLLAVVHPDRAFNGSSAFLKPAIVGAEATVVPAESGTLYLRINDSAGLLSDNRGKAEVQINAE
ncbi:MAG: hypothetical protein IT427_03670 [Pirellulales bacterium]|nr:hypothetical protein [Pirellulales bacterium]